MSRPPELNRGQRWEQRRQMEKQADRYLENVQNGMTRGEAALAAGYSQRRSRVPFKSIEAPEMRRRMQRAVRRKGNPFDLLAETIINSMSADKAEERPDENGKARLEVVADHKTRLIGAKTLADVIGLTERVASANAAIAVNITLPSSFAHRYEHCVQASEPATIEGEPT